MLNIDLKARMKNKSFWVAMASAIALLAQQLGLSIIPTNYTEIVNTILMILTMGGVIVDTSTAGISDKVVSTVTENTVQAENIIQEVQTKDTTTAINNEVSANSASSNIVVDNPDNTVSIGQEVNTTSAVAPQ